jgi:hypothetical protein
MSDYTTPEDILDDLYDKKYDPDQQFLPDEGKYEVEIGSAQIDPRKPYQNERGSGEIPGRYRLGLKIVTGPSQQSGADPTGKMFFGAEVPIPGGDWNDPKFELYGNFTSIDAVKTASKQQFRRFLDSFGWTAEHGTSFKSDPLVFVGLKTVSGATASVKHYTDKNGETRCRVYFNPPR